MVAGDIDTAATHVWDLAELAGEATPEFAYRYAAAQYEQGLRFGSPDALQLAARIREIHWVQKNYRHRGVAIPESPGHGPAHMRAAWRRDRTGQGDRRLPRRAGGPNPQHRADGLGHDKEHSRQCPAQARSTRR